VPQDQQTRPVPDTRYLRDQLLVRLGDALAASEGDIAVTAGWVTPVSEIAALCGAARDLTEIAAVTRTEQPAGFTPEQVIEAAGLAAEACVGEMSSDDRRDLARGIVGNLIREGSL
jgi:hypothetical protein